MTSQVSVKMRSDSLEFSGKLMPELFFSLHDSNDGDYGQSFFKDLTHKS